MSSSSESDSSDTDQADKFETVTKAELQGRWRNSLKSTFTVRDETLSFGDGTSYPILPEGDTVSVDGWHAVPSQSDASRIVWTKEGKRLTWTFEGDLNEDAEPEVDTSFIITTKRVRKKVNYQEELKRLKQEEAQNGGSQDPLLGKRKSPLDAASDSDDDFDHVPAPRKKRKQNAPRPEQKHIVPPTAEEVAAFVPQLKQIPQLPVAKLLHILSRLAVFKMTLKTLKVTKIGVPVNKLRKHTDSGVAKQATHCVKLWKSLVPR